jgi:RHS repeat-associated protein
LQNSQRNLCQPQCGEIMVEKFITKPIQRRIAATLSVCDGATLSDPATLQLFQFSLYLPIKNTQTNQMLHYTCTATSSMISRQYPFGMAIPSQSYALPNENDTYQNRYLYNGKEYQDDFELNWGACPAQCGNYGARFYDAQIGRWHSVDPLAEKYYHITPYRYGLNNPMRFVDAFGLTEEERITALQFVRGKLGTPYSFGVTDCSWLVAAGIQAAGFSDLRKVGSGMNGNVNGVAMIVGNARLIRKNEMLPGDLVTFKYYRW